MDPLEAHQRPVDFFEQNRKHFRALLGARVPSQYVVDAMQNVATRLAGHPQCDDLLSESECRKICNRVVFWVVVDTLRQHYRQRPQSTDDSIDPPAANLGLRTTERIGLWMDAQQAMDVCLCPTERSILEDYYLAGRPTKDIADDLGITPATLRNRRSQAIKKLRSYLGD